MKQLMTGNEALARGAYEAGVRFASAYPGTPSTEILENIINYTEITSEWAPNEKAALEAAIGASLGGVRSMASMKHVGLNVAADPLFTFAYTGVNGGMVVITADEPGQHSSQNEQDNRLYALAAKLPMLEPSDSAECRDMIVSAFDISEAFDTPVLIRVTTRVCHSKSVVELREPAEPIFKPYEKNAAKNLMVPANAIKRRAAVEERMKALAACRSPYNRVIPGGLTGVIASGACYYYAREVFGDNCAYLKLGFTNPLPDTLLAEFMGGVDTVFVIEENDPYIENWVKARGFGCVGKDLFPPFGEMTPDVLRKALDGWEGVSPPPEAMEYRQELVANRPPTLCAGCPHRGFFYELGKMKDIIVSGDIGCYTLGFAPPYNAMDTCVCMGSAFSVGHGLQKAMDISGQNKRVVGVMGDSTFFHTGMNALLEVVYNNSPVVCVILDNRITAMTGHQENPGSGKSAGGAGAHITEIEPVVRALGIRNVTTVDPNDLTAMREALTAAIKLEEPSVIITRWPCVLKRMDAGEKAAFNNPFTGKYRVDGDVCISCKICVKCGCPAVSMTGEGGKAAIDREQCAGCGVCAQVCPKGAVVLDTNKTGGGTL